MLSIDKVVQLVLLCDINSTRQEFEDPFTELRYNASLLSQALFRIFIFLRATKEVTIGESTAFIRNITPLLKLRYNMELLYR